MTIQYRRRSQFADEEWRHRVMLCREMLLCYAEKWCMHGSSDFPTAAFVSKLLYLFSPRCIPDAINVRQLMSRDDQPGLLEYGSTWSNRTIAEGTALIDILSKTIHSALTSWEVKGIDTTSVDAFAEMIVHQIVRLKYVVFHHTQTTRRDNNG